MSRNLLLAVHAEHRQRTGHDVFTFDVLQCDVCAYLNAAKESLDELERKYLEAEQGGTRG